MEFLGCQFLAPGCERVCHIGDFTQGAASRRLVVNFCLFGCSLAVRRRTRSLSLMLVAVRRTRGKRLPGLAAASVFFETCEMDGSADR